MGWRPWWVLVASGISLLALMAAGNILRAQGIIP